MYELMFIDGLLHFIYCGNDKYWIIFVFVLFPIEKNNIWYSTFVIDEMPETPDLLNCTLVWKIKVSFKP